MEPAEKGFTDLFSEEPEKEAESPLVKGVVSKTEKEKRILGPKPKIKAVAIPAKKKKAFDLGGFFLKAVILLALLSLGFFYTQLSPTFDLLGGNPVQKSAEVEESIKKIQTEKSGDNYLIAVFKLNRFSLLADSYFYNQNQIDSEYTSENTRHSLQEEQAELQEEIKLVLGTVQEKIKERLYPKELVSLETDVLALEKEYEERLNSYFEEKITELKNQFAAAESDELKSEIRNLESAQILFKNESFRKPIIALDLANLTPEQMEEILGEVNQISQSDFSIVAQIKDQRINWSEVISRIEEVTKEVDPLFGSEIEGNLSYLSYSFNSREQTITLQSQTKTDDAKNFTLISNLIDALEKSTYFKDVSNRSFGKTENRENGFMASFTLKFKLQEGEDERDAPAAALEEEEEAKVSRT